MRKRAGSAVFFWLVVLGCSGSVKKDAKTAVDVNNAICAMVEAIGIQSEFVQMECSIADAAGEITKFMVKVPKAQAKMMAGPPPKCP